MCFGVVENDSYEDVPPEVLVGREIGSRGWGGSRTGRRSVEQLWVVTFKIT